MPEELSNTEVHWDEFADWTEDNGVSLECKEDWGEWFDCWTAAIEAERTYREEENR